MQSSRSSLRPRQKAYTHFTSPSGVMRICSVHRALFEKNVYRPARSGAAESIFRNRTQFADAERDSKDVTLRVSEGPTQSGKPAAYRALIIDVRNFGFFVDFRLAMSGLVPLSGLDDGLLCLRPEPRRDYWPAKPTFRLATRFRCSRQGG